MKYTINAMLCIAFVLGMSTFACGQTPTIFTVAGNGSTTFGGDGGPATNAGLNNPMAVVADAMGNIYFSDGGHSCLRKVSSTSGSISTIAGTPTVSGYYGDGGQATAAKLMTPTALAISPTGDIVFSDSGNACLRKVSSTSGSISTIVGVASLGAGFGGDGGPATAAQISNNISICFDALGNLYIADGGNHCLRKVSSTSGSISTIAGTPTVSGFSGDSGPATNAKLNNPTAVAVDTAGNIYVADGGNGCLRKVSSTSGSISTIAGTPTVPGFAGDGSAATACQLNNPSGLAVTAAGKIFISDRGNNRMRVINPLGVIHTVVGTDTAGFNGDGLCTSLELNQPIGVCLDTHNNCYIADHLNNRVRYIDYTLLVEEALAPATGIQVAPNPSKGDFSVTITNPQSTNAIVEVYNLLGQKIKEVAGFTNQTIKISMEVPIGVYILRAVAGANSWSKQIIVSEK